MTIWAHTLVKNEERYIWYSVMSVIEYVDKIMIWDTGSSDKTLDIISEIKKIHPKKIDFRQVGEVDSYRYTKIRQKMLEVTKSDWFMILDGDEVWWDESIKEVINIVGNVKDSYDSIVTPYFNLVGDIFHYQSESAGRYEIDGKQGFLTIRFINMKIPGLYTAKPHGQHGYFNKDDILIQNMDPKRRMFINKSYLHFTNLLRSSSLKIDRSVPKRDLKYKYDIGVSFPENFYYPEVFFKSKPKSVPDPWFNRTKSYEMIARIESPLKFIKHNILKYRKSGY